MEANFLTRHPVIKDILGVFVFIISVVVGTIVINTFIFRSFSVLGPSMETTFYTNDRLIVNRVPVTVASVTGKSYTPERGQIIVFKNPNYTPGTAEEFIVKRVIAFAGEHVVLKDGKFTVYSANYPQGLNPDANVSGPGSPTTGEVDKIVPSGTLFVAGDHRTGEFSLDSRNGLGMIPLYDVIGPVGVRIYPFDKIKLY